MFNNRAPKQIALLVGEIDAHGGIQSFMRRIVEVMATFMSSSAFESRLISLNDKTERLGLIPVLTDLSSAWGAGGCKLKLVLHALLLEHKIDVLIVGHVGLAPLALVMKLTGRLRSYWIQLHGIEAWRRLSWLERLALLGARGILATTQFTVQECARYNRLPLDRFQIIPLCANEQTVEPNPDFKLNGSFKLLCVARQDAAERHKGFEMSFSALAKLKDIDSGIHLNLVGEGSDQSRLRAVVDKMGIESNVTFWGGLSDEDLAQAYKDCDVFVMPSKEEGFGIVFLEAMRSGKPCIGGHHGGTPDVIEHGLNGYLVEQGNVPALIDLIQMLIENVPLRHRIGAGGQASVAGKFSWRNFLESYRALFIDAEGASHGEEK